LFASMFDLIGCVAYDKISFISAAVMGSVSILLLSLNILLRNKS
jgi:hypothetical protein